MEVRHTAKNKVRIAHVGPPEDVVYEDDYMVIDRAPTDEELKKILKEIIREKGRPVTWDELRRELSGIAGEDRLRRVLTDMIWADEVVEMIDGSFGLPGMETIYVPRQIKKRVRPLVPPKFRERWGDLIDTYGSIRAAIRALARGRVKIAKREKKVVAYR